MNTAVNSNSDRASKQHSDDVVARVTWSLITEPGDHLAGTLIDYLGAEPALTWLTEPIQDIQKDLCDLSAAAQRKLQTSIQRWKVRLAHTDSGAASKLVDSFAGHLITPGDDRWPVQLNDLGPQAPHCLWVRGRDNLAGLTKRSVALVGARAATFYGEEVTAQLADDLVESGFTVISGGAYGIDAMAHRATLAVAGDTIAVLAGGADRFYPRGNTHILEQITGSGAVISELPPGSAPTRSRFLTRNRIIAALSSATVVVEAAWRSGALSTAHHALAIARPVGAIPGPVTSMMSAGTHRLLREGAVCVTSGSEVAELAGNLYEDLNEEETATPTLFDDIPLADRAVYEALPLQRSAPVMRIAYIASRTVDETLASLGRLELSGHALRCSQGWSRSRKK